MKKIQNLTNVVRPIIICATTVTICRVMAIYMSDGNIVTAYSYEKTCDNDNDNNNDNDNDNVIVIVIVIVIDSK